MSPAAEPQQTAAAEPQAPENTNARERTKSDRPAPRRLFAMLNRSKLLVAFLGLLGAAVAPVTTLIYKNAEMELKSQELQHAQFMEQRKQRHSQQLENTKQQHEFQKDFLREAISPEKQNSNIYYRRDVLEFYAKVLDEKNPIHGFAQSMLSKVNEDISLREQLKASETKLQAAEHEIKGLNEKIQRHAREGLQGQVKTLKQDLEAREDQATELRRQVSEERSKVVALSNGLLRSRDPCPSGTELVTSVGPDALPYCITEAPKQIGSGVFWKIELGAKRQVTCVCKPLE